MAGRVVQDRCRAKGHPYNGATNAYGAHICVECIRERKRRRYYMRKHAVKVTRLLRDGMAASAYDIEAVKAWQQKVWQFFERLEEEAAAKPKRERKWRVKEADGEQAKAPEKVQGEEATRDEGRGGRSFDRAEAEPPGPVVEGDARAL